IHGARVGWINGYDDGSFRPDAAITRAEFIALVNRMLGRDPESESEYLASLIYWQDNAEASAWYYLDVQQASKTHYYTPNS
ncbi:MAG: S-layer homology domain-containing protein, partial [Oscillospiraceae bacterium]|nr:S-layer homology domain-containing protein [Oscillospiraceae bacterium]